MHLFRHNLDINEATTRRATERDLTPISRLLRSSTRRYMGFTSEELPTLLAGAPAMLLEANQDIWAVAIGGWRSNTAIWLRGLAFNNSLPISDGLDYLLPAFHALLRTQGIDAVFYAGDEATDTWLQPALVARGYTPDTEVVVYEKRGLAVPSQGNPDVRVRRGHAVDLPAVLEIDRAGFEAQWNKDEGVLGPALVNAPTFLIAELNGQAVGYAFVTTHFNGRLIHLVRIAVLPHLRGQAIGVRLLAEVILYARTLGADSITLNTQSNNAVARRLYEWFGFRLTGESQTVLRYNL
ncbi:MAG TPA: GNAT family N-acetyltransferase [Roseiflexaceae bacterium]|nr:GNAT family N-acetyltransferase [Roseiflexaceae bacterium]